MERPNRDLPQDEEDFTQISDRILHGDVLDAVVSQVSHLDFLPASLVSRSWRDAVLSSFRCSPRRPPPWLILHTHSRHQPSASPTCAFDLLSRSWRSLPSATIYPPPGPGPHHPQVFSYLRSPAGGTLICFLSLSTLALAADPLCATWRHMDPPRCSRTDPIVAAIGPRVVIAGGASDLEDGANAVEMLDGSSERGWEACEPMPEAFNWAEAISAAVAGRRLYVVEKQAPFTASWFDSESRQWEPARSVRVPDTSVRHVAVGFAGGRLLMAGAGGSGAGFRWRVESVRLWAVDADAMEAVEEVGEMPKAMVEALVGGGWSLGFLCEGRVAYLYNMSAPREFVMCELEEGGGCRWERVPPPPLLEGNLSQRVVASCGEVSINDLKGGLQVLNG